MTDTYTIYGLRDPVLESFRYVGLTKSPDVRVRGHKHSAIQHLEDERRASSRVFGWVSELRVKGLLPSMEDLDTASSKDAGTEKERQWIARLYSEGHPLLNREVTGKGSGSFCPFGDMMMRIATRRGVCGSAGIQEHLETVGYQTASQTISHYLRGSRKPNVEFHSAFALAFQINEDERKDYALAATYGEP